MVILNKLNQGPITHSSTNSDRTNASQQWLDEPSRRSKLRPACKGWSQHWLPIAVNRTVRTVKKKNVCLKL